MEPKLTLWIDASKKPHLFFFAFLGNSTQELTDLKQLTI